jgi:hypothetical protein
MDHMHNYYYIWRCLAPNCSKGSAICTPIFSTRTPLHLGIYNLKYQNYSMIHIKHFFYTWLHTSLLFPYPSSPPPTPSPWSPTHYTLSSVLRNHMLFKYTFLSVLYFLQINSKFFNYLIYFLNLLFGHYFYLIWCSYKKHVSQG